MIVFFRICAAVGIFLTLWSCISSTDSQTTRRSDEWKKDEGKLKVLSTIAMIADLVKQIGGEDIDSMVLIKGGLDPHSYQLVKGDDEKLARSDVIFYNGLGLEHGSSLQHHLASSAKSIALGNKILEEAPEDILIFQGQADPHIWMDLTIWSKTVPHIVKALSDKDPSHAEKFEDNGKRLQSELLHVHNQIRKRMQAIPVENRYLVTSHDAFNYFTRAYLATEEEVQNGEWQKRFAAPEGLAPESQLSSADIQHIINHLRHYRVHVLFPESNVSRDSIRKILQAGNEKGLRLIIANRSLYADAMGSPGSDGDTYLKMVEHNVHLLEEYLSYSKLEK